MVIFDKISSLKHQIQNSCIAQKSTVQLKRGDIVTSSFENELPPSIKFCPKD